MCPNHMCSIDRVTNKIKFILSAPGETEEDQAENLEQLKEARAERATLQRQLAELTAGRSEDVAMPEGLPH